MDEKSVRINKMLNFVLTAASTVKTYIVSLLNPFRSILKLKNIFIVLITAAVLVGLVYFLGRQSLSAQQNPTNVSVDNRYAVSPPLASTPVNNDFKFKVATTDNTSTSLSKPEIEYTIESADLRTDILIKGEKATAVEGKNFLVLNLKLKNDLDKNVNINTRDYVRLLSNQNSGELLAPEIHNDPVDVQAISTKYTRLGFTVSEAEKNFTLQVGEIDGPKTTINLHFL